MTGVPFSGLSAMLQTLLNWLTGLVPLVTAFVVAYHQVAKTAAGGDEMAAAHHNRATKTALVSGAIATSAVAIANFVLQYFK